MELLYFIEFHLICIGIMMMIFYYSIKKADRGVEWRIFLHFQLQGILFVFASLMVRLVETRVIFVLHHPLFPRILRSLYIMIFQAVLYYESLFMRAKDFEENQSIHTFMSAAPCVLISVLALFSIPFDIFYRYEEGGVRIRGVLADACYIEILIYIALLAVTLIVRRRWSLEEASRNRIQLMYLLGLWFGTYVDFRYSRIEILLMVMTLNLFLLYVTIITTQISTDSLTHINNRQHLLQHIAYKMTNYKDPLYLIMADIDFFKKINDQYGHVVGDEAIVRVANAMKAALGEIDGHPFLARYGGDEFIICMETKDPEAPKKLMEEIRQQLKVRNEKARHARELSISLGMTEYQTSMHHPREFINAVDEALYIVKQKTHEMAKKSS